MTTIAARPDAWLDTMIGDLDAVGLDELMERAALLCRTDRKYLLPLDDLAAVLSGLPTGSRVLDIDGRRVFDYRSVYLDTPDATSYLGTARQRRRRFKVRTRSYLDSGLHVLEVKTRGPRELTVKQRLPYAGDGLSIDRAELDSVITWLDEVGAHAAITSLQPILITHYRRLTFLLPDAGGRMTIDLDVRWSRPGGSTLSASGLAVAETKTAGPATAVDRLLWSLRHRPQPLSKFGLGLAALEPRLPANRWRPILRRHFDPVTAAGPDHRPPTQHPRVQEVLP